MRLLPQRRRWVRERRRNDSSGGSGTGSGSGSSSNSSSSNSSFQRKCELEQQLQRKRQLEQQLRLWQRLLRRGSLGAQCAGQRGPGHRAAGARHHHLLRRFEPPDRGGIRCLPGHLELAGDGRTGVRDRGWYQRQRRAARDRPDAPRSGRRGERSGYANPGGDCARVPGQRRRDPAECHLHDLLPEHDCALRERGRALHLRERLPPGGDAQRRSKLHLRGHPGLHPFDSRSPTRRASSGLQRTSSSSCVPTPCP